MCILIMVLFVTSANMELTADDVRQRLYSLPKTIDMRNVFRYEANYNNVESKIFDFLKSNLEKSYKKKFRQMNILRQSQS